MLESVMRPIAPQSRLETASPNTMSATTVVATIFNELEYVTGLSLDYPNVSDFVYTEGAYTFDFDYNEWDMESTGAVLKIYKGDALEAEYPIVLYGDITGDGLCDTTDYAEAAFSTLYVGLTEWEDFAITDENAHAWAADLNHDAVLDGTDTSIMVELQGYIIAYNQAWVDGDEPFEYI